MEREGFVRLQNKKEKKRRGKNNKGMVRDKRQAMEEKGFFRLQKKGKNKRMGKNKTKRKQKTKNIKR